MDKLKFFSEQMDTLQINYQFGEWKSDVVYPYTVGEISEEVTDTEDGAERSTMLLTLFHRGEYKDMETIKNKIKRHFPHFCGLRAKTESGAIAVFYENCFYVPSGEADLKKMQINLSIKEWKGDV